MLILIFKYVQGFVFSPRLEGVSVVASGDPAVAGEPGVIKKSKNIQRALEEGESSWAYLVPGWPHI